MPSDQDYLSHWGWFEVKAFLRFITYSISSFATIIGLWISLDLPQVASREYVNIKFTAALASDKVVQSQINAVRLQMNKMNRQALEAEKYRLAIEMKTNTSYDVQKRLQDIEEQLEDAKHERENILKSYQ